MFYLEYHDRGIVVHVHQSGMDQLGWSLQTIDRWRISRINIYCVDNITAEIIVFGDGSVVGNIFDIFLLISQIDRDVIQPEQSLGLGYCFVGFSMWRFDQSVISPYLLSNTS